MYLQNKIKPIFYLIYLCLIVFSCRDVNHKDINGSWYNVDISNKTYEEIHIDDSLFIYCFDNCDILIPFLYSIKDDSIYFLSQNEVIEKHQIVLCKSNNKMMILGSNLEKKIFEKMESSYDNLNEFLIDFETLDSLSYDYHQRKNILFGSLPLTND